jgi:hypothetical protein
MKRIHNTAADQIFLDGEYDQGNDFKLKPVGLWYSFDRTWTNWCKDNFEERVYPNFFELELKKGKLLYVRSLKQARELSEQYRDEQLYINGMLHIDWNKLKPVYPGIEFPNYWKVKAEMFNDRGPLLTWLYGIDVPSGCIWDLSIIKKVTRIEKAPVETGAVSKF